MLYLQISRKYVLWTAGRTSVVRRYATKVDIKALKRLRELNSVSMSKAKEALVNTDNDIDQALEWLEKDAVRSGAMKAEKVKGRAATEGAIAVHVNDAQTAAAIIELGCETDFVARNATFVDLASAIARAGIGFGRGDVLASIEVDQISQKMLGDKSVGDTVTEAIGRLGENMVLRRALAVGSGAASDIIVSGYIHGAVAGTDGASAGKIGGLIVVRSSSATKQDHRATLAQLARRLAQQVVGYAPKYKTVAEWKRAKAAGAEESCGDEPEVCVLEAQQFLFGGGTIAEVLAKVSKGVGAPVEIVSFARIERGEGVEKAAKPDFANEVRQQLA
ncbi:Elongation factor Ts, mitochondrial [Coemansia asiatica]|uniref:Elongation factor Ts, mitochondrial n=1 Tax=Coemansia asiatica TaxID=1052880 RepID=A0A9W8CL80_9FUNG|nr:Elongation factor Ts, mitochondrial [Coemansia asiatica]